MSRQIQHSEINNLIDKKEITRNYARIGCCNRCYLEFPNDKRKYYYNNNKPISTILQNKIISKYDAGIKLKFEYSAGGQSVDKSKFKEFESEYKKSQDESPLTITLNVEFEIHINMRERDANVEKTKKKGFRLQSCMVVSAVSNCLLNIRLLRWCTDTRTVIMRYYQCV